MKQQGNIASNKIYNPKNKKPDIPLDADEVDSAMERFIRKKYQEKSLVDGRPEPPSRVDISPSVTQTSQPSPSYDLPPTGKKHKFFGFSLRTSSKKDRAGVDNAFKITPVEYSPTSGNTREVPDHELQVKLAQLRDMGFSDNERNLEVLKRSGGDIERTIATLIKLGPSEPRKKSPSPAPPSRPAEPSKSNSNNPFDQLDQRQQQPAGFGLSVNPPQSQPQAQSTPSSANPWQAAMHNQPAAGLEQQFSGLQVSNPLFPHHTGGYAGPSTYQHPQLQTMTPPPLSAMQQQYGYVSSPASNTSNPFYPQQQPLSSQSTGNNPFLQHQQSQPVFAPSPAVNPFLGMQQQASQTASVPNTNPFGLAPSQQTPQAYVQSPQGQSAATNPFGFPTQTSPPPNQQLQTSPFNQQTSSFAPQQQQFQSPQSPQPELPNFQYGQPQVQQPQSHQGLYQNQQFQQQPQSYPQIQQLQPQGTGRLGKNDIMALFSQPSHFQQQPLAPVQEAYDDQSQLQQQASQPVSPAPSNNPYGSLSPAAGKRAATMPVPSSSMSNMHSSGGIGSRNPFLSAQSSTSTLPSAASPFGQPNQQMQQSAYAPQGWNQGARHASNESVSVNNPALMEGRHSPDAFAVLSSRY